MTNVSACEWRKLHLQSLPLDDVQFVSLEAELNLICILNPSRVAVLWT